VNKACIADLLAAKIDLLYKRGTSAYWIPPLILSGSMGPIGRIKPGDGIVFCCRRGEREVQLTRAFVDEPFFGFPRDRLDPLTFVLLTLYHPDFDSLPVGFHPYRIDRTLTGVISQGGLLQLHLAEQEKYAHVTYFFNGGRTDPFPDEVDLSVQSFLDDPLKAPPLLTARLKSALAEERYPFVVINIASGDLIGHYPDLKAKIDCAEAVDRALGEVLLVAKKEGYWTAITADHGLLEEHGPEGGPINTSHTTHPVPFLLISPNGEPHATTGSGRLADVAPTILSLLHIEEPQEMTGRSLVEGQIPEAERVMLVILDGWGLGEEGHINPIEQARTPVWDELTHQPITRLVASGEDVGLLPGKKGNSESGHMNMGAGRVVVQDDVRIAQAIESGEFSRNKAFRRAIDNVKRRDSSLHLVGILSRSSSHGSLEYPLELLRVAQEEGLRRVYLHFITDGRSTQPGRSSRLLREVGGEIERIGVGAIVTLVGRGYALDRGGDYEGKTKLVYEALVAGKGTLVKVNEML